MHCYAAFHYKQLLGYWTAQVGYVVSFYQIIAVMRARTGVYANFRPTSQRLIIVERGPRHCAPACQNRRGLTQMFISILHMPISRTGPTFNPSFPMD